MTIAIRTENPGALTVHHALNRDEPGYRFIAPRGEQFWISEADADKIARYMLFEAPEPVALTGTAAIEGSGDLNG